jgi:hypothetical protein
MSHLLQAFKAIRCFMVKLEKVSEDPELRAELGKFWQNFDNWFH